MPKLFVDKSIEIEATATRVWDVLTVESQTRDWASEFALGGTQIRIVSEWSPGAPVQWKDKKGRVVVQGEVAAAVPHALLRYTALDVERPNPPRGPDDGIAFKLTERDGRTTLWVSQGDFSNAPDGARQRDLADAIWTRALARIKRRAEGRA